jgi:hypothetical protein
VIKAVRRIEPISRSACPFCQGGRAELGRSRMPIASWRLMKVSPYAPSVERLCRDFTFVGRNVIRPFNIESQPIHATHERSNGLLETGGAKRNTTEG